jgi:DNA (cytosine-5)-methyltransferase 1
MPTAVDLFCGCGGASEGLRRAGFEHLFCVDYDEDSVRTITRAGFPGIVGRVEDTLAQKERPTLVWASAPCQPFSSAGKRRGKEDERNGYPAAFKAIAALNPEWVVFENVAALYDSAYMNEEILPWLDERFDFVESGVLRADLYGVPQERLRVFVIAGPRRFRFPPWTHQPHEAVPAHRVLNMYGWLRSEQTSATGRHTTLPAPTVSTRGNMYFWRDDPGRRDKGDSCAGQYRLTPQDILALQGMPRYWPLSGTEASKHVQAGNLVPPVLAELIGKSIIVSRTFY